MVLQVRRKIRIRRWKCICVQLSLVRWRRITIFAAMYYSGQLGVEIDREKYMYHYQQAAIGGDAVSRSNLGNFELNAGDIGRAMKHWMISAGMGHDGALDKIRLSFMNGNATKAQFETTLRSYQAFIGDIKSNQRDKAATKAEQKDHFIKSRRL